MKAYNLNHYIYVQINELGWKHLKKTVGESYIKSCISPYKYVFNEITYYKLQIHEVFSLLPIQSCSNNQFISMVFLLEDDKLEKFNY